MRFVRNGRLPAFPVALQRQARRCLVEAANWAVRNQVRDAWPAWDANRGRFPYHILIDPAKRARHPQVWSTCWKTARAAQGLYSAWLVTGHEKHLTAANRAMEYVATLQVFDPACEPFHGAFREESPQGLHVASRDGIEAIQGFISGYQVTRNLRYLARAVAGADFLLRAIDRDWWPFHTGWPLEDRVKPFDHFCFYAGALMFAQLYGLTGDRRYLEQGVMPFADRILERYVRADGALAEEATAEAVYQVHHVTRTGKLAGVLVNDDGLGVALLAAYAVTGSPRYRDAAVGAADFWVRAAGNPDRLAAYPAITLFLADVYRLTRDRKYLPLLEAYARETMALQYVALDDPLLHGCLVGEDLAACYDKRSRPRDYVDLRTTSYALIALAKLAARSPAQWGCAYSCFGWGRPRTAGDQAALASMADDRYGDARRRNGEIAG